MTSQDRISILITFAIGMIVGGYLYLTGFAPNYKLPAVDDVNVYQNFVLTGDSYGACENINGCLSFQLLNDGSYRAIYDSTGAKVALDGDITRTMLRDIPNAFTEELLRVQSANNLDGSCHYGSAESNYRFTVNYNDEVFSLDTCGSQIDYNGATWNYLKNFINYLAAKSQ